MTKSSALNSIEVAVYAVMLVVVSIFIYVSNDESQPLIGIFRPGYLIPCLIYSSVVVLISLTTFKIVKTVLKKQPVALGIAIFGGIPVGLYTLFQLTNWIFK